MHSVRAISLALRLTALHYHQAHAPHAWTEIQWDRGICLRLHSYVQVTLGFRASKAGRTVSARNWYELPNLRLHLIRVTANTGCRASISLVSGWSWPHNRIATERRWTLRSYAWPQTPFSSVTLGKSFHTPKFPFAQWRTLKRLGIIYIEPLVSNIQ